MAHTVIGMFDSASEAQQAVQQLISSGISRDNIDVSSGNSGSSGSSSDTSYSSGSGDSGTTSGSGSLGFPGTGGFADSTTGRMSDDLTGTTGMSGNTGMGSNTGFGNSSTNSTDLNDLSSGRGYSGSSDNDGKQSGITRFFKSLFGGNDDDVNTYSNVAQRSGSIVTVHAQSKDEAETAADILDTNGAVDVNEKASQYGMGASTSGMGSSTSMDKDKTYTGTGTNEGSSINVIEEQLEVGKRQVQTGGVRLRSRIVETPVEESLRLREERVTVERNTVNRPATDADFANFKETSIELTESAEVPIVSKQARVVEEISLDKQVTERDETIRDNVRSTEVDVENLENKNTKTGSSTSSDSDFMDKKNNF